MIQRAQANTHLESGTLRGFAAGLAMQVGHTGDERVKVAVGKDPQVPALVHVQQAPQVCGFVPLAPALLVEGLPEGSEDLWDAPLRLQPLAGRLVRRLNHAAP